INEEDHLRLQCVKAGFDLDRVWRAVSAIDMALERQVKMTFSERLGYLTACPTNVGTGMRVSVMLHLPALTLKQDIKRMHRAADHMNLAMRGLYGEGTQAYGDFWQISNQVTLGYSEQDLLGRLKQIVPLVLQYERKTRQLLLEKERSLLDDKIERALANLRVARQINVEETMSHLSMLRLGISLGVVGPEVMPIDRLNELFIICQPAHLQKREGKSLTPEERDVLRASIIRERLNTPSQN
ncbi:MAG: ATP--guanido phosphotransferase, partial [Planctomycetes bacterium]|nr:ATP--guanido phosphotransferase [Planctomycetota bacterium]